MVHGCGTGNWRRCSPRRPQTVCSSFSRSPGWGKPWWAPDRCGGRERRRRVRGRSRVSSLAMLHALRSSGTCHPECLQDVSLGLLQGHASCVLNRAPVPANRPLTRAGSRSAPARSPARPPPPARRARPARPAASSSRSQGRPALAGSRSARRPAGQPRPTGDAGASPASCGPAGVEVPRSDFTTRPRQSPFGPATLAMNGAFVHLKCELVPGSWTG